MVIAEIVEHPAFELVGVGVSNPDKVGKRRRRRSAASTPTGVIATDSTSTSWSRCGPDALVHYGPTAQYADENIRVMSRVPARRHRRLLDRDDAVGVADDEADPGRTGSTRSPQACEEGDASCFTTGIDPGFANDLFPLTLMGLCGQVDSVRASELLDYTDYEGDYEDEMGIGRPPEFTPAAGDPGPADHGVGRDGADDRARRRHRARRHHHHLGEVGDADATARPPRVSSRPATSPRSGSPSTGCYDGREVITPRARQPDRPRRRPGLAGRLRGRRLPRRHRRLAVDQPGDGVPVHRRLRPRARRGRLPGHRDARAQRRTGRQRAAPAG